MACDACRREPCAIVKRLTNAVSVVIEGDCDCQCHDKVRSVC